MAKKDLNSLIDQFKQEITGFISTDIVEIESGLSIGGGSISKDFDAEVASASYADVVKANSKALEALGGEINVGETEDILITTTKAYILLVVFPNKKYYHGLAITRNGNLAYARIVMKKYQSIFMEALPEIKK
jgi:predicted regulator of Ras-like GTPase activity (Roadblock/LC7/MglB family)